MENEMWTFSCHFVPWLSVATAVNTAENKCLIPQIKMAHSNVCLKYLFQFNEILSSVEMKTHTEFIKYLSDYIIYVAPEIIQVKNIPNFPVIKTCLLVGDQRQSQIKTIRNETLHVG